MFQIEDKINHSLFGVGEIVDIELEKDCFNHPITYIEVHFNKDAKYKTRFFTEESLKPYLI